MTPDEYQDSERFPETTQKGLSLEKQLFLDAMNIDDIDRLVESGEPLTPKQEAIKAEFDVKRPHRKAMAEIAKQLK